MRLTHHLKDSPNKLQRHVLVKKIAHRVHENRAWPFPAEGITQGFGNLLNTVVPVPPGVDDIEVMPSSPDWCHCCEPCRHSLGVAVLAAGADPRAADHRVPRPI